MSKRWLTAVLGLALAYAAPAMADPAADYFKGKTVTYIVATGPGGGYDSYARAISRYLPKYLNGARVLVRNVPGAGHIVGAIEIYAAKPDGLTIGMFNTGLIYDQLIMPSRRAVRSRQVFLDRQGGERHPRAAYLQRLRL